MTLIRVSVTQGVTHRCYDEQERVIKDCDDLIVELMAEEDSDDDSDSNSGPSYKGDDDGGARDDTVEDPKEVPEGDAPPVQPLVEEVHVRPNPIPQRLSPRIEHIRSTSRIPERLDGHVRPLTRTCPGL
jgi:hypothetical protein